MNAAEVQAALDGICYLVDTREQETPSLRSRLRLLPRYERQKLDAGDYSAKVPLPSGEWIQLPVAIERKMDFGELCQCYCQQRRRFRAEFERARAAKVKLYLLVECASWEDAYAGNYPSRMRPQALVASMLAWLARYECQIVLCQKRTTGKLIRDILYREAKEALERMVDE